MTDIILALVIIAIVGSAVAYIYKSGKQGGKCIGCPNSGCRTGQNKEGCSSCSFGCGK